MNDSTSHVSIYGTSIRTGVYGWASPRGFRDRAAMWRDLRDNAGWRILSTWIDEAGEGQTADFRELWERITNEISDADGLILFAYPEDFPLNVTLIEAGMALGMGKPVAIVLPETEISDTSRSCRPIGSWIRHPLCRVFAVLDQARDWIESVEEPAP